MAWARVLLRSHFSKSLLARHTWNHRVRIVVVLLVGYKLVLVELLLHISHVAVGFHRFALMDLRIQLLLIEILGLVPCLTPLSVELTVEDSDAIRMLSVVLFRSIPHRQLIVLVLVHLIEQLVFMVTFDLVVVLLGHLGTLVEQLLTIVCHVVSFLLIL